MIQKTNNADSIIEEIHQTRKEIAENFNGDIFAIHEDARKRQEASDHPVWQGPGSTTEKPDEKSVAEQ